jgi:hypothetical protein
MKTTTLNKIRSFSPCKPSWEKLLNSLGKTKADDDEIRFDYLLETLGWRDTIWCFRTLEDQTSARVALACARTVEHLMKDQRSVDVLDVDERFLNGSASKKELSAAAAYAAYAAYAAAAAADAADAHRAAAAAYRAADAADAAYAAYRAAAAAACAAYAAAYAAYAADAAAAYRAAYRAADAADAAYRAAAAAYAAACYHNSIVNVHEIILEEVSK